jgi:DNA-binding transcriptional LysR family regulator
LAENIKIRPTLVTNSLTALKQFVAYDNFMTLVGEFGAHREIVSGSLAVVPIDHPLFGNLHARLLVKAGRPLPAAAVELLSYISRYMSMFAKQI